MFATDVTWRISANAFIGAVFGMIMLGELDAAVLDDSGAMVTVTSAKRILTLAPFLTEIAYAAGAGEKLVGVSAYSDFPQTAKKIPVIADAVGVNFEALIGLKPDLVLAWKTGNRAADLAKLRGLGIPVFVTEASQLDDIARLLRAVGAMANTSDTAEQAAKKFEFSLAQFNPPPAKKVRVFVEISRMPLMTISAQHSINKIINVCGGENVFASAAALTPIISAEFLMKANPDVVLITQSALGEHAKKILPPIAYAAWPMAAVLHQQFYVVEADYLLRATPRSIQGIVEVCEALAAARAEMLEKPRG